MSSILYVLRVLRGGELCVLVAVLCAGCAGPLVKLPSGPGAPATDAVDILAAATNTCRTVSAYSAEAGLSGKIQADRQSPTERLRVRLLLATAKPARLRIEAVAPFGAPIFLLAANQGDATLYLPRDQRALEHSRPDEIMKAMTGFPVSAEEMLPLLTGCWGDGSSVKGAKQHGADWREIDVAPDHTIHVHRENASSPWRVVAVLRNVEHSGHRWLAEYRDFQNDLPHSLRIVSGDQETSGHYDLRLSLSQVALNEQFGPEVFRVDVPRSAERISLDDLRHARPSVRKN